MTTTTLIDRTGRQYRIKRVWRKDGRFMRPAAEGFRRYELLKEYTK